MRETALKRNEDFAQGVFSILLDEPESLFIKEIFPL